MNRLINFATFSQVSSHHFNRPCCMFLIRHHSKASHAVVFLFQRRLLWLLWPFCSLIQPFCFWGLCFWFWEVFPLRQTSIIKSPLGVFNNLAGCSCFLIPEKILWSSLTAVFYGQSGYFCLFFFFSLSEPNVWPVLMFPVVQQQNPFEYIHS